MRRRRAVLAGAVLVAVAACSEGDPVSPSRTLTPRPLALAPASAIWAEQVTGETGPGSLYSLNMPLNWNGKLVVYVHGFVDAALPVSLPNVSALADAMGQMGFAVAYSSFSENGYNFKDGLQRSHQLSGLFKSKFGKPARTFAMGHSLGGLITLALAEKYPSQYDGALAMCGVVGGTRRELQYIGDTRVVFDYLFPGVLPGDVVDLPPITDLPVQILGPAQNALIGNPLKTGILASVLGSPGVNGTEVVTSIVTALGFHARGVEDLTDRAQGRLPYGNADVTYTSLPFSGFMAALNAGIGRYTLAPNAANWLEHNTEPSGSLGIPVVTLHTNRDPVVPTFHEAILAAKTAAAGSSGNLLQRTVDRYGHCTFTGAEMLTALGDLAVWVETGIKPAS